MAAARAETLRTMGEASDVLPAAVQDVDNGQAGLAKESGEQSSKQVSALYGILDGGVEQVASESAAVRLTPATHRRKSG